MNQSPATGTVAEALAEVRAIAGDFTPQVAVTLGSGLGTVADAIETRCTIPYERIPGLAAPGVAGHAGRLLLGRWSDRAVAVFQGRLHYYEGHGWDPVTLPVRLAARLGARIAVFTNMSGAVNRCLTPGSLAIVDDHINCMGSNPLVGMTIDDPSNPFPDMQEAYSPRLRRLLDEVAALLGIAIGHGVYAAVTGPNYETPAEVRALATLGADLVGMSTVGEVLVARWLGLECCAISCVANLAAGMQSEPIAHADVLRTAQAGARQLANLLTAFLRQV
jgi:purine-nucleoside phosphorylase